MAFKFTDMAQDYAEMQGSNMFHDELCDAAGLEDGLVSDVGPAPEHQWGLEDYHDQPFADEDDQQTEALAAYLGIPEFYAPNLDDSTDIALNRCDAGGAHPSSASKFLHHIPPAAISQKYNAFQSSNVYPMDGRTASPYAQPSTTFDSKSSPATVDPRYDGALTVTSSPVLKLEPEVDHASTTSLMSLLTLSFPLTTATESWHDVVATSTPTPTPLASPTYYQPHYHPQHQGLDFGFQPTHGEGWGPTAVGPLECAYPVLPKQRKYRDGPGSDAGPLAQEQTGIDLPAYLTLGAAHGSQYANPGPGTMSAKEQLVPSQWNVAAAIDPLQFPQYVGDWDTGMLMTPLYREGYQPYMPHWGSLVTTEDIAQLEHLRRGFGLTLLSSVSVSPQLTTPITLRSPVTPGPTKPEEDHNSKLVVYSPITGRRIPVTAGPNGPVLQLIITPPGAGRRRYKHRAVAACAFCRRRKIACGGPKEGDKEGRCGLIKRVQEQFLASLGPPELYKLTKLHFEGVVPGSATQGVLRVQSPHLS
uniref:Zn(2)-C6 fungal-type domain-containing protein n=1 Tax=Ganoderma boninense TaxID=34458 RepID=A0A5K1JYJ0_9APHY|nr:Zn(2)-C6 fungal-type domain-containing protein [Ganoderma boninense]